MTRRCKRWKRRLASAWILPLAVALASRPGIVPPQSQVKEYQAEVPKTILELQQFRVTDSAGIAARDGRQGVATLINLNPAINAWYVLKVKWAAAGSEASYHLQNPKPYGQKLVLDDRSGLVVVSGKNRYVCDLFATNALGEAKASRLIYAPLCDGRIYLRNPATGNRTTLEAATEFVRDRLWGGEQIISLGHILTADLHREAGKIENKAQAAAAAPGDGQPHPALVDSKYADRSLASGNLGIELEGPGRTSLAPGAWYPAKSNRGIFAGLIQPNLIDSGVLLSYKTMAANLDSVEASALCYLIAFDLDRFDLGYELGTGHPRVDWSAHMPGQMRIAALPGPDGVGNIAPLIPTGLISPDDGPRTVSTFTGGFKRAHGAFKYGEFSLKNHATHYGFVENGAVLSKLQPGLATVFVLDDGSIGMKTWTDEDNQLLSRIKHARQNGVPLVEFDPATRSTAPGRLVTRWGPGNWSGTADMKLRSMRSGVALQTSGGKRFFIYAVFTAATPSAMARVFQAYRCDYAMLLDMNALEHTYLALYRRSGSKMAVDHLVKGMSQFEKSTSGRVVPRFLGYSDNRDFFYFMRKQEVKP